MDYEKKYKEANHKVAVRFGTNVAKEIFTDLYESEDERIKKSLIEFVKQSSEVLDKQNQNNMIDWLKKQGDTSEIVNKKKIASDILRGAAINLITWIDYNAAEGNMCLSNMECKDIEDALVSGDWDKIYAYIKKKLEKQGEQKPTDEDMKEALRTEYEKGRADAIAQMQKEWNEEDEENRNLINTILWESVGKHLDVPEYGSIITQGDAANLTQWLKSLKDRYAWKPSDEQMKALDSTAGIVGILTPTGANLRSLYNDLKKLKGE